MIQKLIRLFAVCGFSYLTYKHCSHYHHFYWKSLWLMEGLLYFGFVFAYLFRKDPVSKASGLKEIILPLICGVLPFFLMYEIPDISQVIHLLKQDPYSYQAYNSLLRYSPLIAPEFHVYAWFFLFVGTCITVTALYTLRSSFSIMTEARVLVTRGIYSYIQHPMYFGEYIAAFGSTLLRSSPQKWGIFCLFVVLQWIRLKNEEKKLTKVFTKYEDYKKNCWIRF
ncbi:MAG: hypothetical protein KC646_02525 [Candidatus Cloacimonetes bacterium]|nr:hypothetical protein [Candidatus Cloacimonadota bacterium]